MLLTSFGYSLCFGTIMAKMMRIYYIFNNPLNQNRSLLVKPATQYSLIVRFSSLQIVKDLPMFMFVCCLVGIDVLLLVIYAVVDRNNLSAAMKVNAENPSEFGQVSSAWKLVYQIFNSCATTIRILVVFIMKSYLITTFTAALLLEEVSC